MNTEKHKHFQQDYFQLNFKNRFEIQKFQKHKLNPFYGDIQKHCEQELNIRSATTMIGQVRFCNKTHLTEKNAFWS